VHSAGNTASIGTGVMDEVWRAPWLTRPFLSLGALRRIMFAETGRAIPFTIENWPYVDRFGREAAVTFNRTFELPTRRRRLDATMVYSERRGVTASRSWFATVVSARCSATRARSSHGRSPSGRVVRRRR
jgi:hypothetical protein